MSNKILLFLLCIVTIGRAQNVIFTENDILQNESGSPLNALDDKIKKLLEDVKEYLKSGIGEIGLPPLDPLNVKHVDMNVFLGEGVGTLNGTLDDANVKGLTNYTVDSVNFAIAGFKLNISATLKDVTGHTKYDIDSIFVNLIRLYGHGDLNVTLGTLTADVYLKLSYSNKIFQIEVFETNVKIDNFTCSFNGLMGDDELNDLFNDLIQEMVPQLIDQEWYEIAPQFQDIFIKFANEKLETYSEFIWGLIFG